MSIVYSENGKVYRMQMVNGKLVPAHPMVGGALQHGNMYSAVMKIPKVPTPEQLEKKEVKEAVKARSSITDELDAQIKKYVKGKREELKTTPVQGMGLREFI